MTLSISLLVISIYLYSKTNLPKSYRFVFSIFVFIALILNLFYGIVDYLTGNGVTEAALYHLSYGLTGAGYFDYWKMIIITVSVILMALVLFFWLFFRNPVPQIKSKYLVYVTFIILLCTIFLNPTVTDLYSLLDKQSTRTTAGSMDFNEFYHYPAIKRIGENKNLVVIYAEGLEQTYFDEEIFPGLMNGLNNLRDKSTYFTNIKQIVGTDWTIAGMVANQCGMPLFHAYGNTMVGVDSFLPSAVCLGDLLRQAGYHLSYFGGSEIDFAGKGKFYATHKFDEIYGKEELLDQLEDRSYQSSWGLFDDSLLDMAFQRFTNLSQTKEKFGLFLLTLDTHHPYGNPSKSCYGSRYGKGLNRMLDSVVCSDKLITEFVNKIRQSPYGKNTVVVIVSDHLAINNTASSVLNKGDRKNLFMILAPGQTKAIIVDTPGSVFDIGTTLLPFIGYEGDIGLGRDLLDKRQSEAELVQIQQNVLSWKSDIIGFWDFPKIEKFVEINLGKQVITLDDRKFGLPIMIAFNDQLETTLKFKDPYVKDRDYNLQYLIESVKELEADRNFILVDKCNSASILDQNLNGTEFCLVAGRGDKYFESFRITDNIKLSVDDIKNLTIFSNLEGQKIKYFELKVPKIAHAGGGINGQLFPNTLNALDHNLSKGFEFFELDFVFTKDDRLVCLHDWQNAFQNSFGYETKEPLTFNEFISLLNRANYQNCTLDTLADWLEENPNTFIVTDVKDDNLKALKLIADKFPDLQKSFIPQIYDPSNGLEVYRLGYEQLIWTLYRYNGSNEDVLVWVDELIGLIAVTMPKDRAASSLPDQLAKKLIPTYVHTVNTEAEKNKFISKYNVTEIYTDFLNPQD